MNKYPRIKSVEPLLGKRLRVVFVNGVIRIYDCRPLLKQPPFLRLKDEAVFRKVRPDVHGYGVVWTDDIDLAESELWIHGMTESVVPRKRSAARR